MKVSYRDITSQGASVLWGTRAAERNAETRKKIRKATVVDVYECFILLRIKTKAGNGFLETFTYQEFECMRK